jgi:hypothetical protein
MQNCPAGQAKHLGLAGEVLKNPAGQTSSSCDPKAQYLPVVLQAVEEPVFPVVVH